MELVKYTVTTVPSSLLLETYPAWSDSRNVGQLNTTKSVCDYT